MFSAVVFIYVLNDYHSVLLRMNVIGDPTLLLIGPKTLSLLQVRIDVTKCEVHFWIFRRGRFEPYRVLGTCSCSFGGRPGSLEVYPSMTLSECVDLAHMAKKYFSIAKLWYRPHQIVFGVSSRWPDYYDCHLPAFGSYDVAADHVGHYVDQFFTQMY